MAVTSWEMYGWPRGRWDRGSFDGERRIMCAWDSVLALMQELDASPNWPWAQYPWGAADALIKMAEVIPFGASTAAAGSAYADYEWALVVARYTTKGPTYTNNQYIEETLDPAWLSCSVDETKLRWSDGALVDPNDAPDLHDALVEYQRRFYYMTSLPAWILVKPGGCNANTVTTYLMPGIAFAPETLKYQGASVQVSYKLGHVKTFNVTAKFTYKWSGWNNYWRPGSDGGAWEPIYTVGGDQYIQHPLIAI